MFAYVITLSGEQFCALSAAINSGALMHRNVQLTALLKHNSAHSGIANCVEREIDALNSAAACITAAQPTEV